MSIGRRSSSRCAALVLASFLAACSRGARPSPEVTTLGSLEVTARLSEISGQFPPNKLYDYVYVMRYQVLQVHRGKLEEKEIFVGHYNPLKRRSNAADKFSGKLGGNVERFEVGDVHRLALEGPLADFYMGAIIDKRLKEPGTRYFAVWTDRG